MQRQSSKPNYIITISSDAFIMVTLNKVYNNEKHINITWKLF